MEPDSLHPSDSRTQREIEVDVLARLEMAHPEWKRVNWQTEAVAMNLPTVWQKVKPDAVWRTTTHDGEQLILAECYMRIDKLTAGHVRKMATDVLKLLAIERASPHSRLRCMLVVPRELSDHLKGDNWIDEALRLVEIFPVELLEDERSKLKAATARQANGQARTRGQ